MWCPNMVDLPPTQPNLTVTAIYKHYEDNQSDWRRNHLGASLIGDDCERKLWYSFRWATKPKFDGRMLRLFQTGNREEPRLVKNLRDIGITVWAHDPDSGKQISYSAFGGHFSGSLDGIGIGFEESKNYHVLEFKTSGSKSFNVLKNKGVETAKFLHWAQMMCYMHFSGVDRAFYFCVNKDTDEIYAERVHYNKESALRLISKAERVIFAATPSYQICDTDADYRCRFCDHKEVCHGRKLPEVNCRTCSYADAMEDGTWKCCRDNHTIEPIDQRKAHLCHIFIPSFVPRAQTDADPERGWIMYEGGITNGPGATVSTRLQAAIDGVGKKETPSPKCRGGDDFVVDEVLDKCYPTEFEGF